MLSHRTPLFLGMIWATLLLAVWIGWPNTGCFCADGGFRFFCDAHKYDPSLARVRQTTEGQRVCCEHLRLVAHGDCCKESNPSGSRVASPGCTAASKPSLIAASITPKPSSTGHTVNLNTVPVEAGPMPAALAATRRAKIDTGPPVDLVISLHCLLI